MYVKQRNRKWKAIIPITIASTGTTAAYNSSVLCSTTLCLNVPGNSAKVYGDNFEVTVYCTTGTLYLRPGSTIEPVVTNSYVLYEGESINLKIDSFLAIKGDTTTAAFQAIVWE